MNFQLCTFASAQLILCSDETSGVSVKNNQARFLSRPTEFLSLELVGERGGDRLGHIGEIPSLERHARTHEADLR